MRQCPLHSFTLNTWLLHFSNVRLRVVNIECVFEKQIFYNKAQQYSCEFFWINRLLLQYQNSLTWRCCFHVCCNWCSHWSTSHDSNATTHCYTGDWNSLYWFQLLHFSAQKYLQITQRKHQSWPLSFAVNSPSFSVQHNTHNDFSPTVIRKESYVYCVWYCWMWVWVWVSVRGWGVCKGE